MDTQLLQVITLNDVTSWLAAILAFLVSLLTLYNAARLQKGILAVATAASGAGMLSISGAFFILAASSTSQLGISSLPYNILFVVGFLLLGYGSYKIYIMSKV